MFSLLSCYGTPEQRETTAQPSALPAHPSSAPWVSAQMGPASLHGPWRPAPDEALLGLPSPPARITAHFMPAGWRLGEVIRRPSPKPCRSACKSLILRRALLTVGSPKAYFMNKGNSVILWQCQKGNEILGKSFCVSGPQPSCCRVAPFSLGGWWSTAGHHAQAYNSPLAIRGPHSASSSSDKGVSFLPWATASNPARRVSTPPRPPCALQPTGNPDWLEDRQWTKGTGAAHNKTRLKDRVWAFLISSSRSHSL